MTDDKFKDARDGYGALKISDGWSKEILEIIKSHHGSYVANRDGFLSMAISLYDSERFSDREILVLYQARFTAGKSGAKWPERDRKIKFHLAIIQRPFLSDPNFQFSLVKTKTIESPHGRIRRWIEEGKSPLALLESKEPGAKSF